MNALLRIFLSLILVLIASPGIGAPSGGAARAPSVQADLKIPIATASAQWTRRLDGVEAALNASDTTPENAELARSELQNVREEAQSFRRPAIELTADIQHMAQALGPPPQGDIKEDPASAQRRRQLDESLAEATARVHLADVILARIDTLSDRISERWRFWVWGRMTKVFPSPWSAKTLAAAGSEFAQRAGQIGDKLLNPGELEARDGLAPENVAFVGLVSLFVLVVIAGWFLNRYAGFGIPNPSYARIVASAVVRTNAYAIFPSVWLAGIGFWIDQNGLGGTTVLQATILAHGLEYSAFALISIMLPRILLVPHSPEWRLVVLLPGHARRLANGVGALGFWMAANLFAVSSLLMIAPPSDALASVYSAIVYTLLGLLTFFTIHERRGEEPVFVRELPEALPAYDVQRFVRIFSGLILTAIAIGCAALWVGYTNFGVYLVRAAVITALCFGILRGLRNLAAAAIQVTLARINPPIQNEDPIGQTQTGFWLQFIVDFVFIIIFGSVTALAWGVPFDEVAALGARALGGFKVGSVRLSLADLFVGATVFIVITFATRRLQMILEHALLPRTRIDIGVRQSIVAGTGYLGTVLAAMIAVGAVGIDLSNIAIVAGALSVGIGFGLQNVTNNFVSGLILLFERPVKVGDWVVVGSVEGVVKTINVRSTEIETFDLASVIIPNADLLSHSVTNWTHKDRRGRVEMKISLDPASDPDVVQDLLLTLARDNPHVVAEPAPLVVLSAILPGALEFTLRCFTDDVLLRGIIASEIRVSLVKKLVERGIKLPEPALGQSIGPLIN
jgi:small-conductance mechanosensitive channel